MVKSTNQSLLLLYSLATFGSTTHLSTVGLKLDRISDSDGEEEDAYEELLLCDEAEEEEDQYQPPIRFLGEPLIHVPAPDLMQKYMLPIDAKLAEEILNHRHQVLDRIHGKGDLLVVVGPRRIRDPYQAQECSRWIQTMACDNIQLCMRTNFSLKYNGTSALFEVGHGLPLTRELLLEMALRLPLVGQTQDLLLHHYFDDIFSMLLVLLLLCELQLHREIALGIQFPVGFACHDDDTLYSEITYNHKLQLCFDSMLASKNPHHFMNITKQGLVAVMGTTGNEDTFVVVNVTKMCFLQIDEILAKVGDRPVMIDVGSLGNAEYELVETKLRHIMLVHPTVAGVIVELGDEYDLPTEAIENTPKLVKALAQMV